MTRTAPAPDVLFPRAGRQNKVLSSVTGALILALPALFLGCPNPDISLQDAVLTDIYVQAPIRQVDILLVVDSSGSMTEEQAKLAANFQGFISAFEEAVVDYHIGVITTDAANESVAGLLQGDPLFITPETPDAEAAFAQNVKVGDRGTGLEMGLETARLALSEPRVSVENAGFYRENASLSIVIFSDEDDLSPLSVDGYLNFFASLKGDAAYRDHSLMNVSAVVGDVPYGCSSEDDSGSADAGTRYVDAAIRSEGVYDSICSSDFAPVVTALGLDLSGLREEFFLTRCARTKSLEVRVDERLMTLDVEYEYVSSRKSIRFLPAYIPAPEAEIHIRYEYHPEDVQVCPEE